MKNLISNQQGSSLLFEYLLFSIICIGFFMSVSLNSYEIFLQEPRTAVMENDMSDIGNMMSTMITDMYLILPENGYVEVEYILPEKVGEETYIINADIAYSDQVIEVISASGTKVRVTVGGIATTMPINGTASSSSLYHRISYDSRR